MQWQGREELQNLYFAFSPKTESNLLAQVMHYCMLVIIIIPQFLWTGRAIPRSSSTGLVLGRVVGS